MKKVGIFYGIIMLYSSYICAVQPQPMLLRLALKTAKIQITNKTKQNLNDIKLTITFKGQGKNGNSKQAQGCIEIPSIKPYATITVRSYQARMCNNPDQSIFKQFNVIDDASIISFSCNGQARTFTNGTRAHGFIIDEDRETILIQTKHEYLRSLSKRMPTTKKVTYFPIAKLMPGQVRYSELNVQQKVNNALKSGAVKAAAQGHNLAYDDGKSTISLDKPLRVIKAPFGYILIGGHHRVLASVRLGAQTVPVIVVKDLSTLPIAQFWEQAEQQGYIYPYGLSGKKQGLPDSFKDLVDDPNRYFAALISRDQKAAQGTTCIVIKKDTAVPFIDFKIADVLYANGIHYRNDMGNTPPTELVEQARKILTEHNVPGVVVSSEC